MILLDNGKEIEALWRSYNILYAVLEVAARGPQKGETAPTAQEQLLDFSYAAKHALGTARDILGEKVKSNDSH